MSKRNEKNIHGILNVLKPPGMTSHDVVDCVRRRYGIQRVGHTGILDPAAAGVLVVCLGNATRLSDYISALTKVYRAEVTFGITTDTYDGEGNVGSRPGAESLKEDDVLSLLPPFVGEIQQCPPPQSAVHFQGKKLYEWNRKEVTVVPQPRVVKVESLTRVAFFTARYPRILLEIVCGKGTYVRSLAHDLGQAAGCGAYLSFLVRKAVGSFTLEMSHSLESIEATISPEELLLPLSAGVQRLPAFVLKERGVSRAQHGLPLAPEDFVTTLPVSHDEEVALKDARDQLVALGRYSQVGRQYFQVKPTKVFGDDFVR